MNLNKRNPLSQFSFGKTLQLLFCDIDTLIPPASNRLLNKALVGVISVFR